MSISIIKKTKYGLNEVVEQNDRNVIYIQYSGVIGNVQNKIYQQIKVGLEFDRRN